MALNTPNRRIDSEKVYLFMRACLRFLFWTLNNFYVIPVHFCWLFALCPLKYMAENTYWMLEGIMFRWLLSMVALWSYSAGYHVVEVGDDVWDLIKERTLVLFNHQSTSDVPLIMAAFNSRTHLSNNIMWIMDHVFRLTNFGIVSWAHGDFFIHAGRENRDISLKELEHHLQDIYLPLQRKWLVLFPEGGFLRNRKASSQRYAAKNNLPHLENVALPRVGALKVILDNAAAQRHDSSEDGIRYVIDATIAYPGGRPLDLLNIFTGWRPACDTYFHYRRYNIQEIPREEEALTEWLYKRYQEKESMLQEYYDTGSFPEIQTNHSPDATPTENVRRLPGTRLVHDPLEFVVRHIFYLCSTYLWVWILYRIFVKLLGLVW